MGLEYDTAYSAVQDLCNLRRRLLLRQALQVSYVLVGPAFSHFPLRTKNEINSEKWKVPAVVQIGDAFKEDVFTSEPTTGLSFDYLRIGSG
jgi:hypothetical protein